MNRLKPDIVFIAFLLALIVIALAPGDAYAGDRITKSNDNNTTGDVNIAGESTHIEGNRAYGFSHSLGDVDINDCLASTQWGTIVVSRQRVVLNRWCAAEVYDHKGMYEMAALMRCGIKEIAEIFESEDECLKSNLFTPEEDVPRGTYDEQLNMVGQIDDSMNSFAERLEALEDENDDLRTRYDDLRQREARQREIVRQARAEDQQDAQRLLEALRDE